MDKGINGKNGPGCSLSALYDKLWVISPLEFNDANLKGHTAYLWLKVHVYNSFAALLEIESNLGKSDSWLQKGSESKYSKYCHRVRNSHLQQPTSGSSSETKKVQNLPVTLPILQCVSGGFRNKRRTRSSGWGKIGDRLQAVPYQDKGSKAEQDYFQNCLQTQGNEGTAPNLKASMIPVRSTTQSKPKSIEQQPAGRGNSSSWLVAHSSSVSERDHGRKASHPSLNSRKAGSK